MIVSALGALGLLAAFAAQMARWLRVLQREHYEPASMRRFLGRWTSPPVAAASAPVRSRDRRPITLSHVLVVVLISALVLRSVVLVVLCTIVYGLFAPVGLGVRGRTGALRFTPRLRAIALSASVIGLVLGLLGALSARGFLMGAAVVWAVPMLLELSTRALGPLERRRARGFVASAQQRLERVGPLIVAITGSYGKTSTKNHLVQLLGAEDVVASPASFNNQMGLARAINENLADATRIFVAEMGTYGPGEIRALCVWCPPRIGVVTAIGPVHLERMGSLDVIEQAKFEITERAETLVLNVDDTRLAGWVARLQAAGKKVVPVSTRAGAQARVIVSGSGPWRVVVEGVALGEFGPVDGVQPSNVACALGAALELGLVPEHVMDGLARVTGVAHRAQVSVAASGVRVIDDTFNANPASAEAALRALFSLAGPGRRVVVTPGLIELGRLQYAENLSLAQKVRARGGELIAVGRTNAAALRAGADGRLVRVDRREQAVAWVRENLHEVDAVLYLNDLPDHYP